ncbi:(2Fe-2S)-binding protein [Tindallia californiensis]|uniref:Purine hydroxylase delta subunit apoprotein n=1 Tax=Tindallia californiensis TaxID=159292 RepID=A0A1H3Q7P2_9FIRM|nr:(2Fe-2S)-binding protein [Tindallia californiensis]SDZ09273.1 purine hydroxylase delta subunit apoprotein [Tindallia californiensis]
MISITLTVNHQQHTLSVTEEERLLDLLRNQLQLTGTKEGCGEGECGACTVIMDGVIVNSCLVLAFQANGKTIETIEGIGGENGNLHPIQQAFLDSGAVQCGFCTPGMVLAAKVILAENPNPREAEIREGISGNLCRCTGYEKIVEAICMVRDQLKEGGDSDDLAQCGKK